MDLAQARRSLLRLDRGGWGVGPLSAGVDEEAAAAVSAAADVEPRDADGVAALACRGRLQAALGSALGAQIEIERIVRLPGGAVHAHWAVMARLERRSNWGGDERGDQRDARCDLVLRAPRGAALAISQRSEVEHAVIRAAEAAGVPAPRSYGPIAPPDGAGPPLLVLKRAAGRADPASLLALDDARGDALADRLGRALARLHAVRPAGRPIPPLGPPPDDAVRARIAALRRDLDALGAVRPALEWGLAWLTQRADEAPRGAVCLAHRDFRTANVMIDAHGGLQTILDWEFATWSDGAEDLGWLTAVCWRFHRRDRPCGGFGSAEALLAGYRAGGGEALAPARLGFWRVYALIRWAVITLQQGARFDPTDPDTLDCGLTPWRLAELETEILRRTPPGASLQDALEADP